MDKSYWIASYNDKKQYKELEESINAGIVIIGGGLTGLTIAYYLSKQGKKVIVLEKDKICNHTSGNSTAKITSGHGLFYDYLIKSVGVKKAGEYLEANEQAITNISKIIEEEKIDCDFEWQDAYIFTQKQEYIEKIEKEVNALISLGYPAEFVKDVEIPINEKLKNESKDKETKKIDFNKKVLCALKYKNQAQFNPYRYGLGLANAIEKYGSEIYENTKVINIEKVGNYYEIFTEKAKINAKQIVLATHYPIINAPGFYFLKMYQETSYLIALQTKEKLFKGMYINVENPTISLRTAKYGDKRILLIGGMEHKTGAKIDLKNSYKQLENIAKQLYPDCKILYHWNTEDCVSLDKIPYIGEFSKLWENAYVATGYKKWGITTSNIAGNIITDKILGRKNIYEDVFTSTRLEPIKNHKEFGNMLKEASYSIVFNRLKTAKDNLKDVTKGNGKIIDIDGKKVGIYYSENGKIYAVKPYCSHLGCELFWNNLDKTWDCPCHGSRFTYEGKSIFEPSINDLEHFEMT